MYGTEIRFIVCHIKVEFVLINLHFIYLQHGGDECLLNTIEACTIIIYPDVVRPPIS